MNIYTQLYWLTRLDGIQMFFAVSGGVLAIIAMIVLIIIYVEGDEDDIKESAFVKYCKRALITGIIFIVIATMTPTKKEMIFIVAGGKTIEFVKSDTSISKIPSQTTAIISKFLDEKIEEIEKEE